MTLPTGPMIVLAGTLFALLSLAFAPKRGLVSRIARVFAFRFRCLQENILKSLWKKETLPASGLQELHQVSRFSLRAAVWRLQREGWIRLSQGKFSLTQDGRLKAAAIVRLHRLWELYLTEELGFHAEKVHKTAEEMEHILTPEIERKLTRLLDDPKRDPHHQPIPEKGLLG